MLRDGPIPRFVHGILEYALGVLFIAAPFLFEFDSVAATGMSVAVGVLILILAAASEGPVSLVNQLPLILHVALLYLLSLFLIAAPFILGFSEEVPPRNFFIISGVVLLLITIGTRFRRAEPDAVRGQRPARAPGTSERPQATGGSPGTPPAGSMPPAPGRIPPPPAQPSLSPQEQQQQRQTSPSPAPPSGSGGGPPGSGTFGGPPQYGAPPRSG